jgi:hypothetical protein
LVVLGGRQPQLHVSARRKRIERHHVALIHLSAVASHEIDLIGRVFATEKAPLRPPPTGPGSDQDYLPVAYRPLALHPKKPRADIEHEVISPALSNRPKYTDPAPQGVECDSRLGDGAFLIGRQHRHEH